MGLAHTLRFGSFVGLLYDNLNIQSTIRGGDGLVDIVVSYQNWPPESLDISSSILGGDLSGTTILTYTIEAHELDLECALLSGTLEEATIISYENWIADNLDIQSTILSGTLI